MPAASPYDTRGFGAGDTFTSAPVAPGSSTAGSRSADVKGGTKQVADIAGRDAIAGAALARDHADQMRQEGMLCYVADKGGGVRATFQLQGGITNAFWVELVAIGLGGPGAFLVTNNTGALIAEGSLVSLDKGALGATVDVVLADGSDIDDALDLANVIAIVVQSGGIADAASGAATLWGVASLLYKAGLTPANITRGQDVMLSETAGRSTTPADAAANIPSGGSIHKIGTVVNADAYDGVGADLVQCIFWPSQRREQV